MATSGSPDLSGNLSVVGATITATIGDYEDTDGINLSTVEWVFLAGSTVVQGRSATATLVTTEAVISKGLFARLFYDDDLAVSKSAESNSVVIQGTSNPANPIFTRKSATSITAGSQGSTWDWVFHGSYAYAAGNDDGAYVWDITDPFNPVQLDNVLFRLKNGDITDLDVTDVIIQRGFLVLCGRNIEWDETTGTPGNMASYDISNPAAPVFVDAYQPPTMNPRPLVNDNRYGNDWYQGMAVNPSDNSVIFAASQFNGLTTVAIDASGNLTLAGAYNRLDLDTEFALESGTAVGGTSLVDLSADFSGIAINDRITSITDGFFATVTGLTSSTELQCTADTDGGGGVATFSAGASYLVDKRFFSWETSRIAFFQSEGKAIVSLANHGNGLMLANVTTPATPIEVITTEAPAYEPLDGIGSVVQLRGRNVVIYTATDGTKWQLSCNNIGGNIDRPERGLLTLDVSDYFDSFNGFGTSAKRDLYNWSPIGAADNDDPWIDKGDQPDLGVSLYGDYAYIANGQRGTAVFYVGVPSQPKYLGLVGTNMEAGTNLYMTSLFSRKIEGEYKLIAYYADAFGTANPILYIDEVTNVPITAYIGSSPVNMNLDDSNNTIQLAQSFAVSPGINGTNGDRIPYGPVIGTETLVLGGVNAKGTSSGNRFTKIAIYEAISETSLEPKDLANPLFEVTTDVWNDNINFGDRTGAITDSLSTAEGLFLTAVATGATGSNIYLNTDVSVGDDQYARDNLAVNATFGTWESIAPPVPGADFPIWFEVSIPDTPTGSPTLTTYDNQEFTLNDTINLGVSSNWTNVDPNSFTSPDMPIGLSLSSTGTITGTIRVGGIIGCNIHVVGLNGQKLSAGFTWYERL